MVLLLDKQTQILIWEFGYLKEMEKLSIEPESKVATDDIGFIAVA